MSKYKPKVYLLIEWPESKRVMNHPEAKFLEDYDDSSFSIGGRDCIIPVEIWEKYKNSEYIDPTDERNIVILRDNEDNK
jgi:hypothetical protein